ncbi:glycosyltransferase family 4 protein [Patescibacteria group bacterium]|nr:glycosyltransferase family 4 protein [Patescibacteria group bacterium]
MTPLDVVAFGLDPHLLDPSSAAFARQQAYYEGKRVRILLATRGERVLLEREGLSVLQVGGTSRALVMLRLVRELFRLPVSASTIFLAQAPDLLGGLAWIGSILQGARFFVQDHGGLAFRSISRLQERVMQRWGFWLFRRAERIRVVSSRAKEALMKAGITPEKIHAFPIEADLALFFAVQRTPSPEQQIVTVARLESEKGIEWLLRAFSRLAYTSVRLIVVGSGSQREALERLTNQLGIAGRVTFLGSRSSTEIAQLFSRATLYVQPSRFEGWGMALVEAAAASLPCVTTRDVGCVGEALMEGEGISVVSFGDTLVLARVLDEYLSLDNEELARIGQLARERVRRYAQSIETKNRGVEAMRAYLFS